MGVTENLSISLPICFLTVINLISLSDFKTLIYEGKINEESIVFNNLIKTKKDYIERWEVQLKNSWHKTLLA